MGVVKILDERWQYPAEIKAAVEQWAERIGVKVKEVSLRPMKNKWGSISTAGRLSLNTELLDLPRNLGEFAIVHELLHLLAPNHGKVFKSFLNAYLPDWQEREKKLNDRYRRAITMQADKNKA